MRLICGLLYRRLVERSSGIVRVWVTALALLVGLTSGIDVIHRATVVHATCEHGNEIHAGPEGPSAETEGEAQKTPSALEGEGGNHDHCGLLFGQPDSTEVDQAVSSLTLPQREAVLFPKGQELDIEPLRDAPKTSPPGTK